MLTSDQIEKLQNLIPKYPEYKEVLLKIISVWSRKDKHPSNINGYGINKENEFLYVKGYSCIVGAALDKIHFNEKKVKYFSEADSSVYFSEEFGITFKKINELINGFDSYKMIEYHNTTESKDYHLGWLIAEIVL